MERKLYVSGMIDVESEKKITASISAIAGVSSCVANSLKAQVLVNYDETIAGIDDAFAQAISSAGCELLA